MSDENSDAEREASTQDSPASEFEALNREIEDDPGSPEFPRLAEAYRRTGQIDRAEAIAKSGLARAPERLGGRVALALAMLDQGEITMATQELASILENVPEVPPAAEPEPEPVAEPEPNPEPQSSGAEHRLYCEPLAAPSEALPIPILEEERAGGDPGAGLLQAEIDDAFDNAEAEPDPTLSADRLAEAALLDSGAASEVYLASEHPVFATATMAQLLEGQGDREGAERIRAAIPSVRALSDFGDDAQRDAQRDSQGPAQGDARRAAQRTRIVERLEGWLANIRRQVA